VDGQRITGADDLAAAMQKHKPGEAVRVVFVDRTGAAKTASVTLSEDPHIEVVPVDAGSLTAAQKAFRDRWLESR
jgi:PDZ domain-containing secreted protein